MPLKKLEKPMLDMFDIQCYLFILFDSLGSFRVVANKCVKCWGTLCRNGLIVFAGRSISFLKETSVALPYCKLVWSLVFPFFSKYLGSYIPLRPVPGWRSEGRHHCAAALPLIPSAEGCERQAAADLLRTGCGQWAEVPAEWTWVTKFKETHFVLFPAGFLQEFARWTVSSTCFQL